MDKTTLAATALALGFVLVAGNASADELDTVISRAEVGFVARRSRTIRPP